jgi:modulator of FtsH protease HflK
MSETPSISPKPQPPDWGKMLRNVLQVIRRVARFVAGDGESPFTDLRAAFGNLKPGRILYGLVILAVLAYFLTGIYVVTPGEAAVVRRFGAVVDPNVAPGLHYRLPWPIDRVDIVNVGDVRREVVGVLSAEEDHVHPEPPSKLQVLSGDTNVIDVEIIVQYQISDPAAYLINVKFAPYRLVRDTVRQSVTTVMGQLPVDAILTTERQTLQNSIRVEMQQRLDAYNSGLVIAGINLQKAFPPDEVGDAFVDVSSARVDKERTINNANGYANSVLPQARGEAQRILAEAAAYRSNTIALANGEAQAFESILTEYQTNSAIYGEDITRYRLYLETLELILPRVQIYVVNTQNGETVNLRLVDGSSN